MTDKSRRGAWTPGFRTVRQLIALRADALAAASKPLRLPRRAKLARSERKVLAYLRRRPGGRATWAAIVAVALRDAGGAGALAPALNGLWERKLVRFLAGNVVELIREAS